MMAPVYGLAEQAASLIRSQYNGTPMVGASNSSTQSTTSNTSGGKSPVQTEQGQQTGEDNGSATNGAAFMKPSVGLSLLALIAGAIAML